MHEGMTFVMCGRQTPKLKKYISCFIVSYVFIAYVQGALVMLCQRVKCHLCQRSILEIKKMYRYHP